MSKLSYLKATLEPNIDKRRHSSITHLSARAWSTSKFTWATAFLMTFVAVLKAAPLDGIGFREQEL